MRKTVEKKHDKNPSQKPEALLERLILISTNEGDLILDPFSGTGTTGVMAQRLGRRWVMIEKEPEYNEIARKRLVNGAGKGKQVALPLLTFTRWRV